MGMSLNANQQKPGNPLTKLGFFYYKKNILDVSIPKRPVLHLDVSELHLDMSGHQDCSWMSPRVPSKPPKERKQT
jgi:hypothetical protein